MATIPSGSKLVFVDSAVPTRELKSSRSNSKTEVYTIDDIAETVVTPEYTETIVNISSAQILNMGSSPIELLPAPGVGKYYDIDKIVLEYTHVTTAYTFDHTADTISIYGYSHNADGYILVRGENNFCQATKSSYKGTGAEIYTTSGSVVLNSPLDMTTWNGTDPTLGDGTLRVKIYHKTITFGA